MSIHDYDHLFESAEGEFNTPAELAGDTTYNDYHTHQEEVTYFVSPWIKRNENYAQYTQPRGSQYEG